LTLNQGVGLANAWLEEPVTFAMTPTPIAQPSWWESFTRPWSTFGQGLIEGTGRVVTGINQRLPDILASTLAERIGLTSRTVDEGNGRTVTYIGPASPGVPAVVPIGTGGSMPGITIGGTGISTELILVAVAAIVAVALIMRK
jgi:hypothetical protein